MILPRSIFRARPICLTPGDPNWGYHVSTKPLFMISAVCFLHRPSVKYRTMCNAQYHLAVEVEQTTHPGVDSGLFLRRDVDRQMSRTPFPVHITGVDNCWTKHGVGQCYVTIQGIVPWSTIVLTITLSRTSRISMRCFCERAFPWKNWGWFHFSWAVWNGSASILYRFVLYPSTRACRK